MLTSRYLKGIPADSRAGRPNTFLKKEQITEGTLAKVRKLNDLALQRGQTLAQMAIAWVLRHPGMTSALVGASRVSQLEENLEALKNLSFSPEELKSIEGILGTS